MGPCSNVKEDLRILEWRSSTNFEGHLIFKNANSVKGRMTKNRQLVLTHLSDQMVMDAEVAVESGVGRR